MICRQCFKIFSGRLQLFCFLWFYKFFIEFGPFEIRVAPTTMSPKNIFETKYKACFLLCPCAPGLLHAIVKCRGGVVWGILKVLCWKSIIAFLNVKNRLLDQSIRKREWDWCGGYGMCGWGVAVISTGHIKALVDILWILLDA